MKNSQSRQIRTFTFNAPSATKVLLAGNFTKWQKHPIHLKKSASGSWSTTFGLRPGTYYYRYMVDGEWRDDPGSKVWVDNPFGTHDAVLTVVDKSPVSVESMSGAGI